MPFKYNNFWSKLPLLRALIPLIIGIVVNAFTSRASILYTLLSGLLLYAFIHVLLHKRLLLRSYCKSTLLFILWILIGCSSIYLHDSAVKEKTIEQLQIRPETYIVSLIEAPQQRKNSQRAVAEIAWIQMGHQFKQGNGRIWIYLPKQHNRNLLPGTKLLFTKQPQRLSKNNNPGSFDFLAYSERQQIYYSIFLTEKDYRIIEQPKATEPILLLYQSQQLVLRRLADYIQDPAALGIAQALLIGYRAELDRELLQAYSDTGLVHIIAISGMHLGMIYGLMMFLLSWMNRIQLKWMKALCILTILWGFTFITGAGPSILRAAIMFSFLLIAELIQQKTQPVNNLAGAALLLLLLDPNMLYDAGFQLSFAAVLSIMLYYPIIHRWFWCSNQLIKYLWSLIAVTLSAQILTTPIAIYHFHQFPNYFLFANLTAIPLSGLILYAEILLILIATWKEIAAPLGRLVSSAIQLMNDLTVQIAQLPGALTENIYLPKELLVLFFLLIGTTTGWLLWKNRTFRFMSICSLLILIGTYSWIKQQKKQQFQLIVCNLPKTAASLVTEGPVYGMVGDSILWKTPQLHQQYLKPICTFYQVSPGRMKNISWEHNLLSTSTKSILFLHHFNPGTPPPTPKKIDALILTGNPKVYIQDILRYLQPETIVFDASNPQWKINYWKKDCDKLHLRHHSVPEKGAFVMDL